MQAGAEFFRVLCRFCSAGLLCRLISAAAWPAVAGAEEIPDELIQAWRRRQELVKTARFQFTTDIETRHGAGTAFSHRRPEVLALDGKKWRRETQTLEGREIVSTFDGQQRMSMSEAWEVSILASPYNDTFRDVQLQPLVHWLRPLVSSYHGNVDLSDCELVATDEMVDGQPCLKLRAPPEADGELVLFLFVDPARDYVVLQLLSEVNERRSTQIDITYTQDSTIGWVPSAWKAVWFDQNGEVGLRYSSTLEDYSINEPLSEKLFVIEIQPGAIVHDRASNVSYRVGSDGEKIVIPPPKPPAAKKPAVPAPSAAELKRSDEWNDQIMRGTLFVAVGALVFLCVAVLWGSRRRST